VRQRRADRRRDQSVDAARATAGMDEEHDDLALGFVPDAYATEYRYPPSEIMRPCDLLLQRERLVEPAAGPGVLLAAQIERAGALLLAQSPGSVRGLSPRAQSRALLRSQSLGPIPGPSVEYQDTRTSPGPRSRSPSEARSRFPVSGPGSGSGFGSRLRFRVPAPVPGPGRSRFRVQIQSSGLGPGPSRSRSGQVQRPSGVRPSARVHFSAGAVPCGGHRSGSVPVREPSQCAGCIPVRGPFQSRIQVSDPRPQISGSLSARLSGFPVSALWLAGEGGGSPQDRFACRGDVSCPIASGPARCAAERAARSSSARIDDDQRGRAGGRVGPCRRQIQETPRILIPFPEWCVPPGAGPDRYGGAQGGDERLRA
jgi:hypothetical protein